MGDAEVSFYTRVGKSILQKFNKDQPRHPAGTSQGGQFADTGKGASSGQVKVPIKITSFIEDVVASSPQTYRGRNAAADLVDALTKNYGDELLGMIDSLNPSQRPMVMIHPGDEGKGIPTVWVLGWSKSQGTDIHDHKESEVGINVLRGIVREKVYACSRGCDRPRDAAMAAGADGIPVNEHERDLRQGSSIGLKAPYIHEVFGTAGDNEKKDVTVHGYFPPLKKMTYYTFDDARDRLVFDGEWEEGKEPSEADKKKVRKSHCSCHP